MIISEFRMMWIKLYGLFKVEKNIERIRPKPKFESKPAILSANKKIIKDLQRVRDWRSHYDY